MSVANGDQWPSAWSHTQLGEVIEFTKRPREIDTSGEVPFLPMSLISEDGGEVREFESRRDPKSGTYFEEGDFLLARITPCFENGKQAIPREVPGGFGFATTEVFPLRSEVLSAEFMALLFQWDTVHSQLLRRMEGATGRMRVPQEAVRELQIPVPPAREQKLIVDGVQQLRLQIAHGRTDLEFATKAGKAFEQATMSAVIKGDSVSLPSQIAQELHDAPRRPLKEIAELKYGITAKAQNSDSGPRFLRITDIQNGQVDWSKVPSCGPTSKKLTDYTLDPGDLVFARFGFTTGKVFLVESDAPEAVFASYLIRIRPGSQLDARFLDLFMHGADYWEWVQRTQQGIDRPALNGTKLGRLEVPVPSLKTQQAAVQEAEGKLEVLRRSRSAIEAANAHAKSLWRSLLHEALTGKLVDNASADHVGL